MMHFCGRYMTDEESPEAEVEELEETSDVEEEKELTIEEKRKYVVDFRDYLRKYDNKKRWAKQFIDLYNS